MLISNSCIDIFSEIDAARFDLRMAREELLGGNQSHAQSDIDAVRKVLDKYHRGSEYGIRANISMDMLKPLWNQGNKMQILERLQRLEYDIKILAIEEFAKCQCVRIRDKD